MGNKNEKFKNQNNESINEDVLRSVTGGSQPKAAVMPEKKPAMHLQRPNPDNKDAMEAFYKMKKELQEKDINVIS